MTFRKLYLVWLIWFLISLHTVYSLPELGRWTINLNQEEHYYGMPKSLYKGTKISISVSCSPESSSTFKLGWLLRQTPCYEEYLDRHVQDSFIAYYKCPQVMLDPNYSTIRFLKDEEKDYTCKHFDLKPTSQVFEPKQTVEYSKCLESSFYLSSPEPDHVIEEKNPSPKNKEDKKEELPTPSHRKDDITAKGIAELKKKDDTERKRRAVAQGVVPNSTLVRNATNSSLPPVPDKSSDHQVIVDQDGVYLLIIFVTLPENVNFSASIDVKMESPSGYLSAHDWPLLPFYGVMCGLYVVYALVWLTVSALQWRDLLRIQFWIGGVIFLGLVEKAVFVNEYQSINTTGKAEHAGMIFAEIVSCLKRTLARLLVIIVSLGFGIVKPRLGPALHRIVGVGSLYFILCSLEGCLRVLKPKNDPSNQTIMAAIPLAVLDSAICCSLVQTTRTLRLRRNVVKLGLYRHFTNTLIFSVLASVVYMTWSLYNHRLTNCLTDWKELWVDDAYWHMLFSLILMVIMVLWRPTNNNQRYAFTPLLDSIDDEEEENLMEKENTALNDIYEFPENRKATKNWQGLLPCRNPRFPFHDHQDCESTKARNNSGSGTKAQQQQQQASSGGNSNHSRPKDHKEDDDLKWVEENIPSSLTDTALPSLLDSDEEIMTVRYERNKME